MQNGRKWKVGKDPKQCYILKLVSLRNTIKNGIFRQSSG